MIDTSTIKALSIEEKLQVMEAIWEDLSVEKKGFNLLFGIERHYKRASKDGKPVRKRFLIGKMPKWS